MTDGHLFGNGALWVILRLCGHRRHAPHRPGTRPAPEGRRAGPAAGGRPQDRRHLAAHHVEDPPDGARPVRGDRRPRAGQPVVAGGPAAHGHRPGRRPCPRLRLRPARGGRGRRRAVPAAQRGGRAPLPRPPPGAHVPGDRAPRTGHLHDLPGGRPDLRVRPGTSGTGGVQWAVADLWPHTPPPLDVPAAGCRTTGSPRATACPACTRRGPPRSSSTPARARGFCATPARSGWSPRSARRWGSATTTARTSSPAWCSRSRSRRPLRALDRGWDRSGIRLVAYGATVFAALLVSYRYLPMEMARASVGVRTASPSGDGLGDPRLCAVHHPAATEAGAGTGTCARACALAGPVAVPHLLHRRMKRHRRRSTPRTDRHRPGHPRGTHAVHRRRPGRHHGRGPARGRLQEPRREGGGADRGRLRRRRPADRGPVREEPDPRRLRAALTGQTDRADRLPRCLWPCRHGPLRHPAPRRLRQAPRDRTSPAIPENDRAARPACGTAGGAVPGSPVARPRRSP